ncbi:hypothetical protein D3C76_1778500 [compost metagenome]
MHIEVVMSKLDFLPNWLLAFGRWTQIHGPVIGQLLCCHIRHHYEQSAPLGLSWCVSSLKSEQHELQQIALAYHPARPHVSL